MRILVVEDEKRLAATLKDLIQENNDLADIASDGITGLDNAFSGIYDAIVLDVMLPGLDGFELLRELRAADFATPVLMLTARGGVDDRVHGLTLGADYYLTKPFANAEFCACLKAILRRQGELVPETFRFGDLLLAPSLRELRCGDTAVELSAKELEMMRLLMLHGENSLAKETLLLKIWGYDSSAEDNNVEAYISFLRKKLSLLGSKVSLITVRRVGYHLEVNHD